MARYIEVETFVDTPDGEMYIGTIVIGREMHRQCGYDVIVKRKDNGIVLYVLSKNTIESDYKDKFK